ncbi:MAG TPA: hypothetical protein VMD59_00275 [Acidimicrobiales bacterium]|nr:hypothetical protein [Acidimicrobiales bacterium]
MSTVSGTVTPIATRGHRAGAPVRLGQYDYPQALVAVPATSEALVLDSYGGEVVALDLRTHRAGSAVELGGSAFPEAVAFAR